MTLNTIHEIKCNKGKIFRTGISKDGKILASSHFSGNLSFWSIENGNPLYSHKEHGRKAVRCLAWAPCDFRIASGDTDGNIIIWNFETKELIIKIDAHSSRVRSVAWSPDGTKLVSGSSDGFVKTWNTITGELLNKSNNFFQKEEGDGRPTIHSVKWSPNGKQLASCRGNQSVIWSAPSNQSNSIYKEIVVLKGHTDTVRSVAWSRDGNQFASCSNDKSIIIWDAKKWVVRSHLKLNEEDMPKDTSIFCVHFSPKGDFIATKSTDNSVRIWRLEDDRCIVKIEELCGAGFGENLGGLSFHFSKPYLVTLRNNCENLRIWKLDYDFLTSTDGFYFIDQGFRSAVSHTVGFPSEYEQAGLIILNYFGKIVRDKYPKKNVSVQIIQKHENVTLRIETGEKNLDELESELKNYKRVISGKLDINSFLDSHEKILELKTQLRIAHATVDIYKDILNYKTADVDRLFNLLEKAISPNLKVELNTTKETSLNSLFNSLESDKTILRTHHGVQLSESEFNMVRRKLEKNLEIGISFLREITSADKRWGDTISIIYARYFRNKKKYDEGTIKYDEYEMVLNKIYISTLEIIQEMQDLQ